MEGRKAEKKPPEEPGMGTGDAVAPMPAGWGAITEETDTRVDVLRSGYVREGDPRPEWVRGICPQCGEPVISNCYYVGGRGYLCVHECWQSLGAEPTCNYRRVL